MDFNGFFRGKPHMIWGKKWFPFKIFPTTNPMMYALFLLLLPPHAPKISGWRPSFAARHGGVAQRPKCHCSGKEQQLRAWAEARWSTAEGLVSQTKRVKNVENGPLMDDLPTQNGNWERAIFVYQTVCWLDRDLRWSLCILRIYIYIYIYIYNIFMSEEL